MLMSAILEELQKRTQASPEPASLRKDFRQPPDPQGSGRAGLVITGKTLEFALQEGLQRQFLELTAWCQAVVCCRATPLQKSEVVKLVRNHLHVMTLAIGEWRWEGGHPAWHSLFYGLCLSLLPSNLIIPYFLFQLYLLCSPPPSVCTVSLPPSLSDCLL